MTYCHDVDCAANNSKKLNKVLSITSNDSTSRTLDETNFQASHKNEAANLVMA
jgi:hypothetical protein